jgi:hypothetical protein
MSASRIDLLLHPVRLRLVHALRAAGTITTSELCARLPELPKASVYRQVERLLSGGVFEVESSRQVRGAVERRYRLAHGGANIDADAARTMTLDDHRRGFTAAMAALIGDFGAYLDRDGADPVADEVSYRQFTLWLTPAERSEAIRQFGRLLLALNANGPGDGREPYLSSTIFFPSGPRAAGPDNGTPGADER